MLQVGDKVRIEREGKFIWGTVAKGVTGTVTKIDTEFDDPDKYGVAIDIRRGLFVKPLWFMNYEVKLIE